ncbi:hypothetical protein AAG906_017881 [Vitis piasezkii]
MDVTFVENQSFFPNTYLQGESLGEDKFLCYGLPNLSGLSESMPLSLMVSAIVLPPCHLVKNPHQKWIKEELMRLPCHCRFTLGRNSTNLIKCKLKSLNLSQQLDVKNGFLHDDLKEVYMQTPPHFNGDFKRNNVCKLKNPFSSLKQSPKAWFGRFAKAMNDMELQQSQGDHTLFVKCSHMGGNLVTWRSNKQFVAARSSAKAKFKAMAHRICELLWIKIVLHDLRIK